MSDRGLRTTPPNRTVRAAECPRASSALRRGWGPGSDTASFAVPPRRRSRTAALRQARRSTLVSALKLPSGQKPACALPRELQHRFIRGIGSRPLSLPDIVAFALSVASVGVASNAPPVCRTPEGAQPAWGWGLGPRCHVRRDVPTWVRPSRSELQGAESGAAVSRRRRSHLSGVGRWPRSHNRRDSRTRRGRPGVNSTTPEGSPHLPREARFVLLGLGLLAPLPRQACSRTLRGRSEVTFRAGSPPATPEGAHDRLSQKPHCDPEGLGGGAYSPVAATVSDTTIVPHP